MSEQECPRCGEFYDTARNPTPGCMSCHAIILLARGIARTLADLPSHRVTEEGINVVGQRYVRLTYDDGSHDIIDPMPWDEPVQPGPGGTDDQQVWDTSIWS